jgi:hypothetical protein
MLKFGDFVRNKETKSKGIFLGLSENHEFYADVMVQIASTPQNVKWRTAKIEVIQENKFESVKFR